MKVLDKMVMDGKQLVSHIVLNSLNAAAIETYKERQKEGQGYLEVKITIEGEEVDLEAFLKLWQSQVHRRCGEAAKELMEERFATIYDTVFEIETVVRETLNKLTKEEQ